MIRTVVDTNILISGIFWVGSPAKVLDEVNAERIRLLLTDDLIAELLRVLRREKFAASLVAKGITAEALIDRFQQSSELVIPASIPPDVVRDPNDLIVLACAVGGKADYIVSGDHDLLTLTNYADIPILSAADFLTQLPNL